MNIRMIETEKYVTPNSFAKNEAVFPLFFEKTVVKMFCSKSFKVNKTKGILNEKGEIALVKKFVKSGFLTRNNS